MYIKYIRTYIHTSHTHTKVRGGHEEASHPRSHSVMGIENEAEYRQMQGGKGGGGGMAPPQGVPRKGGPHPPAASQGSHGTQKLSHGK